MIRVLIVHGSLTVADTLAAALVALGDFEVVGTAQNPAGALPMILRLRPQVICAAIEMSGGGGVALTRDVMAQAPTPVILLSEAPIDLDGVSAQQARDAGALGVVGQPLVELNLLATKMRVFSGVKMFTRKTSSISADSRSSKTAYPKIVAIGVSTGGPQTLGRLFKTLANDFPYPILCVQHMSKGFLDGMVHWLESQTSLAIRVAEHGERPRAGTVYFAPEDQHLRVRPDAVMELSQGDPVDGHRPSATVLFQSVARAYGASAIGILLTGMGSDGATGLLEMSKAGAVTMAQDEKSSVVFGMARQAVAIGAVKRALALDDIAAQLRQYSKRVGP